MKKIIVSIAVFCSIVALSIVLPIPRAVQAGGYLEGGCVPVYGGGEVCPSPAEVLVDKKVRNPATGLFVDNLGLSDPKYRPLQIVTFQIKVENSGETDLEKVTVKDTIPNFIDYMSVSPANNASYDSSLRVLTFTVDNLGGGSKQIFTLKARVAHQAMFLQEKNIVCPINVVDAKSDSQNDRDESQFCIEKEMVVPEVPKAGPEHWILSFAGLSTILLTGIYFKKRALQLPAVNG